MNLKNGKLNKFEIMLFLKWLYKSEELIIYININDNFSEF